MHSGVSGGRVPSRGTEPGLLQERREDVRAGEGTEQVVQSCAGLGFCS